MNTQTIPTAEPFFLQGNRTGILLIHGFTGTPKEMRWLGEYLNAQGYTCLGVRLTGHATKPEDMLRARYVDWMASVEDGYNLLRGVTDRIYFAGLSMGGILSLLMSTRLDVAGVIAMATPYQMPVNYPLWFLRLFSFLIRYEPKTKHTPGASWFDKEAYASHASYPQNPVRSGVELGLLLKELQTALPEIRKPVLLIHSKDDPSVPFEHMEKIYARLVNTEDKSQIAISGSGHVITRDAARQQVFKSAAEFVQRLEKM